jgi:hypothetical protein
MTLRTKLEDLRQTPSLAPTAAEYRALLELALAVEARPWWRRTENTDGDDVWECEWCDAQIDEDGPHVHDDTLGQCRYAPADAALARIAEAVR